MTRTVRNIRAAREEFIAAVQWYEEQRPGLGAEFFDAVVAEKGRVPFFGATDRCAYNVKEPKGSDSILTNFGAQLELQFESDPVACE